MSFDLIDNEVVNKLSGPGEDDGAYGIKVNELSVDELFSLYWRTGFLYPDKAARLMPHMDLVRENWGRLLRAGDSLLYVLSAGSEQKKWASIAVWRTTGSGWTWQHHVAEKSPMSSRAIMLGGLAACIKRGTDNFHQNWFRPENRFPARVFGSMVETVGEAVCSVQPHRYFALPRKLSVTPDSSVRVTPYNRTQHEELCMLASYARGDVYVTGEELDTDVELRAVDELYRTVGLRRTRHVWLAYRQHGDIPVGAAIAYRAPLGINFSFIENRCDLLIDPALEQNEVPGVASALLGAATAAYSDFELNEIPVVADQCVEPTMVGLGAEFLRNYCQGIWLKDGLPGLYRHVDNFYARMLHRTERRNSQIPLVV
jgi:hypothetical protein